MSPWKWFFFGNYFYGFCAVMLAIESALQNTIALPSYEFFLILFLSVVLVYNHAYITVEESNVANNERLRWYSNNRKAQQSIQYIILTLLLALLLFVFVSSTPHLFQWPLLYWMVLLVFPLIALAYYGISVLGRSFRLRELGQIKPLFIGLVWSGVVTVYPLLYAAARQGSDFEISENLLFLFTKNAIYIGLLALLFDVKDYETDRNQRLNTVVVRLGVRKTLFGIILPVLFMLWFGLLYYAKSHHFGLSRILLNNLPFLAVVIITLQLLKPRSLLFYLMAIDGLMLFKASCGIVAALL